MLTATRSVIAREPLTPTLLAEIHPLTVANHAAADTGAPFALNHDVILAMDPAIWIARVDGVPVGYCLHLVQPHPFYGEVWATCLAIYMDPAHRMLVRSMIQRIEDDLTAMGAQCITYSVPHLSRAGSFFEAIGYECQELVMGKRL